MILGLLAGTTLVGWGICILMATVLGWISKRKD